MKVDGNSDKYESDEYLRELGLNEEEIDLLKCTIDTLRSLTYTLKNVNISNKFKISCELLQLYSAIKQDFLGDFPAIIFASYSNYWDVLTMGLEMCCCSNKVMEESNLDISSRKYLEYTPYSYSIESSPNLYENSYFEDHGNNSKNDCCCLNIKQTILDLTAHTVNMISLWIDSSICKDQFIGSLYNILVRFSLVILPRFLNSCISFSLNHDCMCKLQWLIKFHENSLNSISRYWNKKLKLWTSLYNFVYCSCRYNEIFVILTTNNVPSISNIEIDNIESLLEESIFFLVNTFNNIYKLGQIGLKIFIVASFSDILTCFVEYTLKLLIIKYGDNSDIKYKEKARLLLNFKQEIPNIEDLNKKRASFGFDEVKISSENINTDYIKMDDHIQDWIGLTKIGDEKINHNDNKIKFDNFSGFNNKNLKSNDLSNNSSDSKFNSTDISHLSILDCLILLAYNENLIEIDLLYNREIKGTFRSMVYSIFKDLALESESYKLDDLSFLNSTLNMAHYIKKCCNIRENKEIDDFKDFKSQINLFINSPSHLVAATIFLCSRIKDVSLLTNYFELLYKCLVSSKDFSSHIVIPLYLRLLFESLNVLNVESNYVEVIFKILLGNIENEELYILSPFQWIQSLIIYTKSVHGTSVSAIILNFLESWTSRAFSIYNTDIGINDSISINQRNELSSCITICGICPNIGDIFNELKLSRVDNLTKNCWILLKYFNKSISYRNDATARLLKCFNLEANFSDPLDINRLNTLPEISQRFWILESASSFSQLFFALNLTQEDPNSSTISPLVTPDISQLSKFLSVCSNKRIQISIRLSALNSLCVALTSSKFTSQIFFILVDELIKLTLIFKCKQFYFIKEDQDQNINETGVENLDLDGLSGIADMVQKHEQILLYHLTLSLTAIFVSRANYKTFRYFILNNYGLLLMEHLIPWIFSNSIHCRTSSSSVLIVLILFFLYSDEQFHTKSTKSVSDVWPIIELNNTNNKLDIPTYIYNMLILPGFVRPLENNQKRDYTKNRSNDMDILNINSSSFTLEFPLFSQSLDISPVKTILQEVDELLDRKLHYPDEQDIQEVIQAIFSDSFPWTIKTCYCIIYGLGVPFLYQKLDSIFKYFIYQTVQNLEMEYLNFIDMNLEIDSSKGSELVAILSIIKNILMQCFHINSFTSDQLINQLTLHIIDIITVVYELIYIPEDNNNRLQVNSKPSTTYSLYIKNNKSELFRKSFKNSKITSSLVIMGIFDTIYSCLNSCNGRINEIFFDLLPRNISWTKLIFQISRLSFSTSSTACLLALKLASKMPLKQWIQEDSIYTIKCIKFFLVNLMGDHEDDSKIEQSAFQNFLYFQNLLDILSKLIIIPNDHPLSVFLNSSILEWLQIVELKTNSFAIQAYTWELRYQFFLNWIRQDNILSWSQIIYNLRISNNKNGDKRDNLTWGSITMFAINKWKLLLDIFSSDPNLAFSWQISSLYDCYDNVLQYMNMVLKFHYKFLNKTTYNLENKKIQDLEVIKVFEITFKEILDLITEIIKTSDPPNLDIMGSEISIKKSSNLLPDIKNKFSIRVSCSTINFLYKLLKYTPQNNEILDEISKLQNWFYWISSIISVQYDIKNRLQSAQIILSTARVHPVNINSLIQRISCIIQVIDDTKNTMTINELIISLCLNIILLSQEFQIPNQTIELIVDYCKDYLTIHDIAINEKINYGIALIQYKICSYINNTSDTSDELNRITLKLLNSVILNIAAFIKNELSAKQVENLSGDLDVSIDTPMILFLTLGKMNSSLNKNLVELMQADQVSVLIKYIWSNINKLMEMYISDDEDSHSYLQSLDTLLNILIVYIVPSLSCNLSILCDIYDPNEIAKSFTFYWRYIYKSQIPEEYSFYYINTLASCILCILTNNYKNTVEKNWIQQLNLGFYKYGIYNNVLVVVSELIVEMRAICLKEFKNHTFAYTRASSIWNLKFDFPTSKLICLVQTLKLVGLCLNYFEHPISLLTDSQVKPLLTFAIESLALIRCMGRQLESHSSNQQYNETFQKCTKEWWKHLKTTNNEIGLSLDLFSNMVADIFNLVVSSITSLVPITDINRNNQSSVSIYKLNARNKLVNRFHDLILTLLETDSAIGLKVGREFYPIQVDDENGNLISNLSQRELKRLNGEISRDSMTHTQAYNMWFHNFLFNESIPIICRCSTLRLFIALAISSSKIQFIRLWCSNETKEVVKIADLIRISLKSKNFEFLWLSLILTEILVSYDSSPLFNSINNTKPKVGVSLYSVEQSRIISNILERAFESLGIFLEHEDSNEDQYSLKQIIKRCLARLNSI
ncbi:uncharacterized protein CMU_019620 [Cryptosporidium muris RN66]|uniref:Uncharacterized protein n=1 Tax=Cryptosporidium muris (strain RN66) TaxID=441375 RepID=B6ACE9_CRYMR|nr:uncharacterized protein CMU_019620 [Cryptosporidium muris RN66]EEA06205.1 hypothetical protein CMU_019620 [Cryptosporidium muris RN66]|eukprot:XP_002140554.1 hypothetical protein [Cryptosporidium muris RN66]